MAGRVASGHIFLRDCCDDGSQACYLTNAVSTRSGPGRGATRWEIARFLMRRRCSLPATNSAAGFFLGHPHVPEDLGHRSDALNTWCTAVRPLKSPKNPIRISRTQLIAAANWARVLISGTLACRVGRRIALGLVSRWRLSCRDGLDFRL